jgi:ribosome-binding factor A
MRHFAWVPLTGFALPNACSAADGRFDPGPKLLAGRRSEEIKMPGRRPERLAEQIREEVSLIVAGELEDPRIGDATVIEAKMSPDLRHAKIYVSVVGTDAEIAQSLTALNHAAGFVRSQISSILHLKHTPELHFVHDWTQRSAERIELILSEENDLVGQRGIADLDPSGETRSTGAPGIQNEE